MPWRKGLGRLHGSLYPGGLTKPALADEESSSENEVDVVAVHEEAPNASSKFPALSRSRLPFTPLYDEEIRSGASPHQTSPNGPPRTLFLTQPPQIQGQDKSAQQKSGQPFLKMAERELKGHSELYEHVLHVLRRHDTMKIDGLETLREMGALLVGFPVLMDHFRCYFPFEEVMTAAASKEHAGYLDIFAALNTAKSAVPGSVLRKLIATLAGYEEPTVESYVKTVKKVVVLVPEPHQRNLVHALPLPFISSSAGWGRHPQNFPGRKMGRGSQVPIVPGAAAGATTTATGGDAAARGGQGQQQSQSPRAAHGAASASTSAQHPPPPSLSDLVKAADRASARGAAKQHGQGGSRKKNKTTVGADAAAQSTFPGPYPQASPFGFPGQGMAYAQLPNMPFPHAMLSQALPGQGQGQGGLWPSVSGASPNMIPPHMLLSLLSAAAQVQQPVPAGNLGSPGLMMPAGTLAPSLGTPLAGAGAGMSSSPAVSSGPSASAAVPKEQNVAEGVGSEVKAGEAAAAMDTDTEPETNVAEPDAVTTGGPGSSLDQARSLVEDSSLQPNLRATPASENLAGEAKTALGENQSSACGGGTVMVMVPRSMPAAGDALASPPFVSATSASMSSTLKAATANGAGSTGSRGGSTSTQNVVPNVDLSSLLPPNLVPLYLNSLAQATSGNTAPLQAFASLAGLANAGGAGQLGRPQGQGLPGISIMANAQLGLSPAQQQQLGVGGGGAMQRRVHATLNDAGSGKGSKKLAQGSPVAGYSSAVTGTSAELAGRGSGAPGGKATQSFATGGTGYLPPFSSSHMAGSQRQATGAHGSFESRISTGKEREQGMIVNGSSTVPGAPSDLSIGVPGSSPQAQPQQQHLNGALLTSATVSTNPPTAASTSFTFTPRTRTPSRLAMQAHAMSAPTWASLQAAAASAPIGTGNSVGGVVSFAPSTISPATTSTMTIRQNASRAVAPSAEPSAPVKASDASIVDAASAPTPVSDGRTSPSRSSHPNPLAIHRAAVYGVSSLSPSIPRGDGGEGRQGAAGEVESARKEARSQHDQPTVNEDMQQNPALVSGATTTTTASSTETTVDGHVPSAGAQPDNHHPEEEGPWFRSLLPPAQRLLQQVTASLLGKATTTAPTAMTVTGTTGAGTGTGTGGGVGGGVGGGEHGKSEGGEVEEKEDVDIV